jgi:hypothetical protein
VRGNTKKSILAIIAGFVAIVVVTTGVDALLHLAGVFPPWSVPIDDRLSALATAYRVVITVGGAYLTATLAPENPMKHALILGCVGTFMGALGVVATWDKGLGPRWYPIALALLALPECWAGAKLYLARRGSPA